MEKRFTAQIVIGATIKADSVWLARKIANEFVEDFCCPPDLEMTALSVSFIPRNPDPMELLGEMGRPQAREEPPEGVAGSIPKGAQPS